MRTLLAAIAALTMCGTAAADQWVNGYVRRDGTYVAPHYRSAPDSNAYNNYSARGNTNPYTGARGYTDPLPVPGFHNGREPSPSSYLGTDDRALRGYRR